VGFVERWARALQKDAEPSRTEPVSERQVRDLRRIAQILLRLSEARALVSARIIGCDETFLTALLGVDARQHQFYLDELSPRSGHEALLRDRALRVASRLEGVEVLFSATLASVAVQQGIAVYTLPFPHVLHYNQRRASHRIGIGAAPPTAIQLVHPVAGMLTGEVRDISAGGLAVRVQVPDEMSLAQGDRLADCIVSLRDDRILRCDLEVCHVQRLAGSRWTSLGTRFIQMPRQDQHLIAHFIVQLERERLKIRPSGSREG
jgi:c-di-GMP-binding flagellar brake protein YcgR